MGLRHSIFCLRGSAQQKKVELQPLRKRQYPARSRMLFRLHRFQRAVREAAEVAIFPMVVNNHIVQVLPPFVERKASMPPPENGTITVPLG